MTNPETRDLPDALAAEFKCEHVYGWSSPAGSRHAAHLCMACHQPDPDWLNSIYAQHPESPASLPSSIDASPEPAPVDPAPPNGPQIANLRLCAHCGTDDDTCCITIGGGGPHCCEACRATAGCTHPKPEGVGTGAGEGAPRQDTGSAWVTRSADCPEAPAQARPLDRDANLGDGANGRLSDDERIAIDDVRGCGCCSSHYGLDGVIPDDCPREGDYVDHTYADGCNQMLSMADVVERIVREHAERAWEVRPLERHAPDVRRAERADHAQPVPQGAVMTDATELDEAAVRARHQMMPTRGASEDVAFLLAALDEARAEVERVTIQRDEARRNDGNEIARSMAAESALKRVRALPHDHRDHHRRRPSMTTTGLEARYQVHKNNDPDGKHDDCWYFVLDPTHDPRARIALRLYAHLARTEDREHGEQLWTEIQDRLRDICRHNETCFNCLDRVEGHRGPCTFAADRLAPPSVAAVREVRDHYASPTAFPADGLVPVASVVSRLDAALATPTTTATTTEGDR